MLFLMYRFLIRRPQVFLALVALLSMGEIIVSMNMFVGDVVAVRVRKFAKKLDSCKNSVDTSRFVAQMAYFNRISDDAMGGTYMTLLNTFANLGYKLPSSIGYFLVDFATRYVCARLCVAGLQCACMVSRRVGACGQLCLRLCVTSFLYCMCLKLHLRGWIR